MKTKLWIIDFIYFFSYTKQRNRKGRAKYACYHKLIIAFYHTWSFYQLYDWSHVVNYSLIILSCIKIVSFVVNCIINNWILSTNEINIKRQLSTYFAFLFHFIFKYKLWVFMIQFWFFFINGRLCSSLMIKLPLWSRILTTYAHYRILWH